MKFKRFRYNLIVFGLVAIIGCSVALPLIMGEEKSVDQGISLEETIEATEEDVELEEDVENQDEEDEESFADMSDVELLNYAIDKLYNGKGFYSTYTQTASTTATAVNMTVPQNVKGIIVRNGKNSLQESYYYSSHTGTGSDSLKKYYQYDYIDRSQGVCKEGISYLYDENAMTHGSCNVNSMSYQEAIDKSLMFWGDSFPIIPSRKNGDSFIKDEIDKKGKYRTIVVQYNISKLSKCVKELFSTTGQLKDINYSGLSVTYKINIKTGKMYSITRVEKLGATAINIPVLGSTPVLMTATTVQSFKSVDKEQTIVIPS